VRVLLAGWAYRFQVSKEGRRNIGPVLLPGDVCDLDGLELDRIDHSVATFTTCRIAEFPRRELAQLCQDNGAIGRAFRMMAMLENALLAEWLVNIFRRPASERVGHFFCELQLRLRNAGLDADEGFDFPLTQMELADVLGLSPVHVNRTLQSLRSEELIDLHGQRVSSSDWRRLRATVGFNARYLHLGQQGMSEGDAAELQLS
jgi:CRP-like cAMP-binding protein